VEPHVTRSFALPNQIGLGFHRSTLGSHPIQKASVVVRQKRKTLKLAREYVHHCRARPPALTAAGLLTYNG
jgi:hypothetical protein